MNSRERLLVVALVSVVGVGGFGIGSYLWFVKPLVGYNKTIRTMRDENDIERQKWDMFLAERKKLEFARLKSLPHNAGDASSEYGNYLERMIAQTGLKVGSIVPSQAVKVKPPVGTAPNIKDVGHLLMTFTLNARGELADLVKFMELLQATPYEHRIRSMSVDRADATSTKGGSNSLVINMVIETLLVAHTDSKPGHLPGIDTKVLIYDHIANRNGLAPAGWGLIGAMAALKNAAPTPDDRDYDGIARKNIFVGWKPPPSPPPPPGETPPPPEPKSPGNIPAFIRLVQTVPTQHEAYLINLFYRNEEYRLSSDSKTGYQVRRISDDTGDYVFFYMKVLRVDPGVVYFQVRNHVFGIRLGQTLNDALQDPLSIERMDVLDLDWDREWAKEQMSSDTEEKAPTKKSSKKGKKG